jgi:hypothetical protein
MAMIREDHLIVIGVESTQLPRRSPAQRDPLQPAPAGRVKPTGAPRQPPSRANASQNPTDCRMRTMWMRPGNSWWISRIFPTELFCP